MVAKKKYRAIPTAKQLHQQCQQYFKDTFKEVQTQCKDAVVEMKVAVAETKQAVKGYQAEMNALEGKLVEAKDRFKQKKIKTLENTIKKTIAKLKESKRLLQQATKNSDKFTQELHALTELKTKSRAREVHFKTFEKDYQPPVKSALAAKAKKSAKSTALIEAGLKAGDKAPDFMAVLDDNQGVSLAQFKGKNVVLYFYPKDSTPGCTTEAKDFTAMLDQFTANDSVVLGVSRDSMASHHKFAEKYGISYTLLADTDETICQAYGVIKNKNMVGKKVRGIERSTFLIDKQGQIKHVWRGVKVPGHVEAVLAEIEGR